MVLLMVGVQFITFLAIVFVMKKLLHAESLKEVERLKKLREEATIKQKELQEKLDQAQSIFDQKMAAAEESSRLLSAKSEAEVRELRRKMLDKAKEDAGNIMKAAYNTKEKIREEIAVEMMQKAPVLASSIFSAVLSENVRELTHKELVQDVIGRIKALDKAMFKTPVDYAEIVSAKPLPAADKSALGAAILQSLGHEVSLSEKADAKVAVGVVVRLGSINIDGSLENRMRQAEREIAGSLSTGRDNG